MLFNNLPLQLQLEAIHAKIKITCKAPCTNTAANENEAAFVGKVSSFGLVKLKWIIGFLRLL